MSWSAEAVASLPPPGLSGPSQLCFSPGRDDVNRTPYLAFVSSSVSTYRSQKSPPALYRPLIGASETSFSTSSTATHSERMLMYLNLDTKETQPLLAVGRTKRRLSEETIEEKLRRERQRIVASSGSLTQFSWVQYKDTYRILIPARGALYIQDGIDQPVTRCLHEKPPSAVDPQLSPDGTMVAWIAEGNLFVKDANATATQEAVQITYGTTPGVSYGVADFIAQEEMDRYRGFWWHPESTGILLCRVDETRVPLVRILHHDTNEEVGSTSFEDHRYPFCGKENPKVTLGYVKVDRTSICQYQVDEDREDVEMLDYSPREVALQAWNEITWFDPPREASEYLARVHWLPDGTVAAQWQNRPQTVSLWTRIDIKTRKARTLLFERSDVWINLHHIFTVLPKAVHPHDCHPFEKNVPPIPAVLPSGSFSFLYASERTGFLHLYLYSFIPGINGEQAILLRTVSAGEWMVEKVIGVDMERDVVFFTGTYDSVLERHLYALPITNKHADEGHFSGEQSGSNGVRRGLSKVMNAFKQRQNDCAASKPIRVTRFSGMHCVVMDDNCRFLADTSSDLDRPTAVHIYAVPDDFIHEALQLVHTLYDALHDEKSELDIPLETSTNGGNNGSQLLASLPAPELISFPTSDGSETLHAAFYRPDERIHGIGPHPLVCAVYGGPHVQRVNRSWSQCADMRAQRLRSLGFCVVKCDNRGSSRRGLAFESAIARRLGRLEVLDQVAAVRQLVIRGLADAARVGVYGWSYGGYLAAMCLCRAPDVFHAAVAGAPVTSWDGYDTHYTERYMGLPADNPGGYRESAIFDHVPNMRGKLMIVHGLIDENVHFRHSARLINKLILAGKDYDLLVFPDERHSPRRLRDRIYMEQRIGDFFLRHLGHTALDAIVGQSGNLQAVRNLAGHL